MFVFAPDVKDVAERALSLIMDADDDRDKSYKDILLKTLQQQFDRSASQSSLPTEASKYSKTSSNGKATSRVTKPEEEEEIR